MKLMDITCRKTDITDNFQPPNPNLEIAVVIPARNEPNLKDSVQSVIDCRIPEGVAAEIIVVLNSSESDGEAVLRQNAHNWDSLSNFSKAKQNLDVFTIQAEKLPSDQAGVGLARKLGMDRAASRLSQVECPRGIICCFDADSRCDSGYLTEIYRRFHSRPLIDGCSIAFEHPIRKNCTSSPIIQYELFLRYGIEGLRFAGHPHAFHTVGSSMAVTASAYIEEGGMNTKQAAEDFHFLQKIIKRGRFGECHSTVISPSDRTSDRVPFGTGAAMNDFAALQNHQILCPPPTLYMEISGFIKRVMNAYPEDLKTPELFYRRLPKNIRHFFSEEKFCLKLTDCLTNTTSKKQFAKRFFRWFDGLQSVRLVHHLRDSCFGRVPVGKASSDLLNIIGIPTTGSEADFELLLKFRELQNSKEYKPTY